MKLVVGLGNPGSEYEETRHNAGFKAVDLLATECSAQFRKKSHVFRGTSYDYAKTTFGKDELVILKPLTYMNLSGSAVKAALVRLEQLASADQPKQGKGAEAELVFQDLAENF